MGVTIYALMAAGGDLGSAVGPQLVGTVVDFALACDTVRYLATTLNLTVEQLSMKIGLITAIVFPLVLTFCTSSIIENQKSRNNPFGCAMKSENHEPILMYVSVICNFQFA